MILIAIVFFGMTIEIRSNVNVTSLANSETKYTITDTALTNYAHSDTLQVNMSKVKVTRSRSRGQGHEVKVPLSVYTIIMIFMSVRHL